MTSDVHALVGAYAVDAVDDLERAAFERHLAVCEDCRLELASLQEAAVTLASLAPLTPPDRLREQVLAGIGSIRPLPPEVAQNFASRQEAAVAPARRRFRPAALVAAAAAVIALGVTPVVWQQVADDDTSQVTVTEEQRVQRIINADDAEEYTQKVDGVEVTVVRSRSLNGAVLASDDMPAPPEGRVYELWLAHDKGLVPAGLMTGDEGMVLFEGDPATAMGAGITVEPEGGSDQPTTEPVASFTFEKA